MHPPPCSDLTTEEGLIAGMKLMEPKHFLIPFFAHSLGSKNHTKLEA